MLRKSLLFLALFSLLGTAAWAKPPIQFSFASDDFHEGPTFTGDTTTIQGKARVDLMLDQQGDFEGGVVIFPSLFSFDGRLVSYQVVAVGANFLHIWEVEGSYGFAHYDLAFGFPTLLKYGFRNAVLTSLSPVVFQAGESMTLQDNWTSDALLGAGDGDGLEAVLDLKYPPDYVNAGIDFAFTLTHVRVPGITGPPPLLDASGSFREPWESEGSFSASSGD
jgi:hypothetical protein